MTTDPLNIGIVCYPTPGGSGVVATELGMSLAQRGNKVHFITSGHPSRLSHFDENLFLHKVETGEYPLFQKFTPYSLSLAVKIREVADQYDLDLVHVHYAIPHAASAYLAKQMLGPGPRGLRTLTTLHGTDITLVGMMPSFYEITRFSISVSDGITAVSNFLRDETITEFKIDAPIDVIHNFVDGEEFKPPGDPQIKQRLAPNGERLIIHVSNFRKVKNIPVVLEVFGEVKKELPARLVLVGDGPEIEATERQAADMGIGSDVVFLGDQEYIAEILPAADVFFLPSEHESFGLAALEAMSCEVPVVGSRVGGLHEVVVDGETGFLCDPHDVACMTRLILSLLNNDEHRRKMGEKARERAISQFGRDRIVSEYIDVYRRLIRESNDVR
jgi:N-acetyl-alpha-D-glucosaminyl L-malate synthase BshA